ncbi:MAG TPA: hypothetical protein VN634_11590 [Candidatus Limnocylindrales bacterium]|nr:hypothetical protein [Candidatus Limnocylindrales bacterium]
MNYDDAFDATLRARHGLLSLEEIRAAERRRQGRLLRDDPECYAMVDAFKLHRAHTDAFRLAIDDCAPFMSPGQTVCAVDLGAGAGNVAAALVEAWTPEPPVRLTYIGVEPHSLMRRLGIEFVRTLAPPWLDFAFAETSAELSIPRADHYLVSFNYVLHQPGITERDLKDWAALVATVNSMGRTCLLCVSPCSISPALSELDRREALRREMTASGLVFELHSTSRRMDRRMPRDGGRGWVVQPARGAEWHNVQIERYDFPT